MCILVKSSREMETEDDARAYNISLPIDEPETALDTFLEDSFPKKDTIEDEPIQYTIVVRRGFS